MYFLFILKHNYTILFILDIIPKLNKTRKTIMTEHFKFKIELTQNERLYVSPFTTIIGDT